jgi:hypothetical protein
METQPDTDTTQEVDRMSRTRVRFTAFALLACSALLFASFGCSNPGTVTAPDSTPLVVTSPNLVRILSTSKSGDGPATTQSASATISAQNGGTVSNGRVSLDFPPGALNQDTQITIEMLNDGTVGVELSPHGIQFNKPVTMSVDLRGTTAEGQGDMVDTYYWNEDAGLYETQQKLNSSSADKATAALYHFCKYTQGLGG